MLQSEFETRVGRNTTPEKYAEIEQVYNASDVNKDEFCRMWAGASLASREYMIKMAARLKNEESVVANQCKMMHTLETDHEEKIRTIKDLQAKKDKCISDVLMAVIHEYRAADETTATLMEDRMRNTILELAGGQLGYLRILIEGKYDMTDGERECLLNYLAR